MEPLGSQLAAHGSFSARESPVLTSSSLYTALRSGILIATDCVTMLVAIAAVLVLLRDSLVNTSTDPLTFHKLGLALLRPSITIAAYFLGRGRYTQRLPFWSETGFVLGAGCLIAAIESIAAILSGEPAHRVPQLAAILLFTVCAPFTNRVVKHILAQKGIWTLPSLIIAGNAATPEISQFVPDSLDYRIVGQVDGSSLLADPGGPRLRPLLVRHHCEHLFIGVEDDPSASRVLTDAALRERIPFSLILPLGFRCKPTHAFGDGMILLSRYEGPLQALLRLLKIAIDVIAAASLIIIVSPFLLAIAIAIKWDGGPAFFAHRRLGAHGQYFHCLKFRTMVMDADEVLQQILATDPGRAEEWNATQKLRDDPRITRIGRFLRKTSLDELPQLINVLRLEMSLIGPRPIVEAETKFYGSQIDHYYAIRPGVTGLWQVSGRSDTSYDRRVWLDTWYVNNWSIWHDIVILLKTIPAVLKREGAR